jgi:hypothetical protein
MKRASSARGATTYLTEAATVVLIVIKTNNTCSKEQSWDTYFPLVTLTNETEAAIVVFMVILNERYF